jgi:hypothetical protein
MVPLNRDDHLEGRLGRPIPTQALMTTVEITIML